MMREPETVHSFDEKLLGRLELAKLNLFLNTYLSQNLVRQIGKNNIQAIALGIGGGAFEVILPKDVKIVENDTVMIPDLSTSVFGIVKNITIDAGRAFSTILFSQPINIYEQKWVFINRKDLK